MVEKVGLNTHANFCGLFTWLNKFLRPSGRPLDAKITVAERGKISLNKIKVQKVM